jgi:hypothetical protein
LRRRAERELGYQALEIFVVKTSKGRGSVIASLIEQRWLSEHCRDHHVIRSPETRHTAEQTLECFTVGINSQSNPMTFVSAAF